MSRNRGRFVAAAARLLQRRVRATQGFVPTMSYTNRQIAAKLYITVSTVEQHLTKVYSKLKVTRRHDLPFGLHREAAGSSAAA